MRTPLNRAPRVRDVRRLPFAQAPEGERRRRLRRAGVLLAAQTAPTALALLSWTTGASLSHTLACSLLSLTIAGAIAERWLFGAMMFVAAGGLIAYSTFGWRYMATVAIAAVLIAGFELVADRLLDGVR